MIDLSALHDFGRLGVQDYARYVVAFVYVVSIWFLPFYSPVVFRTVLFPFDSPFPS